MDRYLYTVSLWWRAGRGAVRGHSLSIFLMSLLHQSPNSHTILALDFASCLPTDRTHILGFQCLLNSTFSPSPCFWPLRISLTFHSIQSCIYINLPFLKGLYWENFSKYLVHLKKTLLKVKL